MELRQLEYFRAIVDEGSISGAARALHMTQPPLSYQMKMLEEELQVSLFLRGTKKITLTEAGKTLYEQAETLLMLANLTKQEVIKSGQAATLHIGMTPSTVSMMSDFLVLTTLRTPIVLNGCETYPLAKESLLAMAIPEYPILRGRSSIKLRELSEQPLILSHRYQKYMFSAFEKAGLICDIYLACEDARTAMTMAEKGLGIAILSESMLTRSDKLHACQICDADLTTEILLAWRKGRLPEEIRELLDMIF